VGGDQHNSSTKNPIASKKIRRSWLAGVGVTNHNAISAQKKPDRFEKIRPSSTHITPHFTPAKC
jgi:hypothetical protein